MVRIQKGIDIMPYLKPINGYAKEVPLNIIAGKKFLIGREVTNGLALPEDTRCSRAHAEIFKKTVNNVETYFVRDLKSTNGTFLNTKKLSPTPEGVGEKLTPGAKIIFGNTIFEFMADAPKAAPSAKTEQPAKIPSAVQVTAPAQPAPAKKETAPQPADVKIPEPTITEQQSLSKTDTVEIKLDDLAEQKHHADFIGKRISSKHLTHIYEVSRIISSEKTLNSLMDKVLDFIINTTKAKFGYIILLDKHTDKITLLAAFPRDLASKTPRISKTIVKRVTEYTRPILTSDAMLDSRFTASASIATGSINSVICVPLIKMTEYDGVMYLDSSVSKPFTEEDLEIASAVAIQAGLAMISISASDKSKRILMSMVKVLVSTVEMRDMSMQGHSERVANYSSAMAKKLGLTPHEISQVQLAAFLHDIGKIAATSTAKEEHIYAAEKLLSQIPDLGEVIPAIKFHHERFDGQGFPYRITNIPLIARIISAANALDNMVTRGGIKSMGMSVKDAVTEIESQKGKEFDPAVVNALIASYNDSSLFKSTRLFEELLQ